MKLENNEILNVSRRSFLKVAGLSGGGLIVGFSLTGCSTSAIEQ
jgi:hypothetical protein